MLSNDDGIANYDGRILGMTTAQLQLHLQSIEFRSGQANQQRLCALSKVGTLLLRSSESGILLCYTPNGIILVKDTCSHSIYSLSLYILESVNRNTLSKSQIGEAPNFVRAVMSRDSTVVISEASQRAEKILSHVAPYVAIFPEAPSEDGKEEGPSWTLVHYLTRLLLTY